MSDDRRRPEQYHSRRDDALRPWIAEAVYPYSRPLRSALDSAGLGRRGVRRAADLGRIPVTPVADLGDGRAHVLEPTVAAVTSFGPLAERTRFRIADAFGRRPEFARQHVDPAFRPVLWTVVPTADDQLLFTASTTSDLERLAVLGRRALATSGVRPDDRVLVLDPAGPGIAPWQLVAGCQDAGVAMLHAGGRATAGIVDASGASVLAGETSSLCRALDEGLPPSVRLLLDLGGAATEQDRERLASAGLPCAGWWAPPGVRAAWVRCPGGIGHHTWPEHEVVDVVDGELVWSAVGWHGSVWLRVGTGVKAVVHEDRCDACGRTTPRVRPVVRPGWMSLLDDAPEVAAWVAVRRADGSLVVLATRDAAAADRWDAQLASRVGSRVVPVSADRLRRVRSIAGDAEVVDEATVADVLRRPVAR